MGAFFITDGDRSMRGRPSSTRIEAPTAQAAQLLGLSLVLWKDGDNWRAFEDSCPHRRGALSEGRVEADGSLLCSYHGWRFDGDGACSSLPYRSCV